MATESYKVKAQIELGDKKAVREIDSIVDKLNELKGKIKAVNFGFGGMITKIAAFAAAYIGIHAVTRGLGSLVSGIHSANAEAESMQASLATIYAAVEKVTFKEAQESAGALFRTLEKIAIVSTATAPELMKVFQGIYGPLRNAGLSLQNIVDLTNNAAVTASALGVDFEQASRDISAMARGTAGLDVKMFSLLQSMGMIKETTEQWNKLAPDKRAKKLMDVMNKIGGQAAEAYGKTWKGLSSTFSDIMGAFKRAFGSAVFERMKGTLEKVNKYLLTNRERIEAYLRVLGERVGTIFDSVINKAGQMFRNAMENMEAVRARMAELYAKFEAIKPMLIAAAKFAVVMQAASIAFNLVAPLITALMGAISWIVGIIGSIGAGGGIAGAFAGIGASLSTFGAALAAAAGPIALIIAAVVALVLGIMKFKDTIWSMLQPLIAAFKDIGSQLYSIFKDIWAAIKPILAFIGGALIMQAIASMRIAAWVIQNLVLPPLRLMAKVLRWAFEEIIHPVFKLLEKVLLAVVKAFEWLGDKIGKLVSVISDAISWIGDKLSAVGDFFSDAWDSIKSGAIIGLPRYGPMANGGGGGKPLDAVAMWKEAKRVGAARAAAAAEAEKKKRLDEAMAKAARDAKEKAMLQNERPITHNDFRGSKISIKQEFREADPDNVWVQFREGLEREATARTRSGFADPLAR